MKLLDLIPSTPTWTVTDSSKLSTYMACPRKYFYQYILGWRSNRPNNHLVFGSAWHLALEHLMLTDYSTQSVLDAYAKMVSYYREVFPPETDELFTPKDMATALLALSAYAFHHRHDLDTHNVLHTEIAGTVMLSRDHTMTFRMDAILEEKSTGTIIALDHKTSGYYSPDWGDHWALSTQMLTYLHSLYCLYPNNDKYIKVRTSFFFDQSGKTKTGRNRDPKPFVFEEHKVEKSYDMMEAWLHRTLHWLKALDTDKWKLFHVLTTDDITLDAFAQNDNACFNYGRRCAYFDLCNAWANPIRHCEHSPIGMQVEYWDPLSEPIIKEIVHLAPPEEQ